MSRSDINRAVKSLPIEIQQMINESAAGKSKKDLWKVQCQLLGYGSESESEYDESKYFNSSDDELDDMSSSDEDTTTDDEVDEEDEEDDEPHRRPRRIVYRPTEEDRALDEAFYNSANQREYDELRYVLELSKTVR